MKRKVTIDKNGYKSTGIWGYVGEQNITDIEIALPDELVPCDFCIAIITNAGRMELTDKLEIIDGKVNVIVPLSCTAAVGKITVQVVGYVMDESEEIYAIGKTAEFEGKIKPSSTGEIVSDSSQVPLLERIWAKIQSWADKIHTHDNYWSLSDLHCVASEAEQGGNNPFPILPDVVGVDRPTYRGNYLSYCSDGAVVNKIEPTEEDGAKFLRMWFNKGVLDTLFDVPLYINIPVKDIIEKPEIDLNGTGLELDLGVGTSGGLTPEQSAELAANTRARHTHQNKALLDTITKEMLAEEVPAVHTLPPDAKDGDMCLYAPQNIITFEDSGKRIYIDWEKFKDPVSEDEFTQGGVVCHRDSGISTPLELSIVRTPFGCTVNMVRVSDSNEGSGFFIAFVAGELDTENSNYGNEDGVLGYYNSIDELPPYIDIPEFDRFDNPTNGGNAYLFHTEYKLMKYQGGEWVEAVQGGVTQSDMETYVTAAINGTLGEIETMIDEIETLINESGVLDDES